MVASAFVLLSAPLPYYLSASLYIFVGNQLCLFIPLKEEESKTSLRSNTIVDNSLLFLSEACLNIWYLFIVDTASLQLV